MTKGSFAELSERLHKKGFEYQYKAGQPSYYDVGKAFYKNPKGEEKMLKRVAKGKPATYLPRPKGATFWLSKTHQEPDIWQTFRRKRI